jgi:hypothetical protein
MTLQQGIDLFAILFDKYSSPNLETEEVIDFLNLGTNEYLNRLFPDNEGGVVNFEMDSNVTANIQPLIYTLTGISMNASGMVTNAALNTALAAASSAGSTYFRVGSIGLTNGDNTIPVKYMKQNNRWSFERNVFKKPTVSKPRFALVAQGLQFFPISTTTPLTINVIKKPKVLAIADVASEVEFADYTFYNIICIGLKFAGISVREDTLLEDLRLSNNQIAQ